MDANAKCELLYQKQACGTKRRQFKTKVIRTRVCVFFDGWMVECFFRSEVSVRWMFLEWKDGCVLVCRPCLLVEYVVVMPVEGLDI